MVSCVIELAMTLPMAIYFHRITLFALPVNLLILPLLLILLPLALLLLAVLCVWPAAAVVPAAAVAAVLHFSVAAVSYFSQRTMADLRISTPQLWQCSLFVALLGISIFLAQTRHMRKALVILLLSAVVAVLPPPLQHPQNALFVEAIDVGQGDALLLISPEGKTLLVDAGGFGGGPRSQRSEYDVGEEVVSTVLWQHGIRHLDAVALTHAHSDHMGGMPAVLRNFHPDVLWVGSNPPVPPYEALLQQASAQHVPVQRLQAGQSLQLGSLQIHVLAPLPEYRPADEPQNNDSLVLRVVAGKTSVLLEGDAEAPVERAMLAEELQSTLLKVGHHGSLTSSMPEFLARVHPQWAVISCGLRNRYGHPREEILTELQNAGVRTLSTDISGPVCFRLDASSGQVSLTDCSSQ